MKTRVLLIVSLCILPLLSGSCIRNNRTSGEYVPIEIFAPAYRSFGQKADTSDYNLESTIRVIRAIELAGAESKSFEEYLEKLAAMDYRYVAPDVLEAEKKLFPILQDLYLKSQNIKDHNLGWTIVQSAQENLLKIGDEYLTSRSFSLKDFLAGQPVFNAVGAAYKLFNDVAQKQTMNNIAKKEFNQTRTALQEAIQASWPVFIKYKEEWEQLCIKKDEAYLDLYADGVVKCYNLAQEILDKYPEDRDALLIKAMSLANRKECGYDAQIEIEALLDKYIELYPTRTAPAYVIRGIVAARNNEKEKAFGLFDQAAIEYPRQAEALTDKTDAYLNRPYFKLTREGLYFQQMYMSTLEGFGFFSPNLQKAMYHEREGDIQNAGREIYSHFFRRGNQARYDYILSDMEFCERYLEDSFTAFFPESSFVDLSVSGKDPLIGSDYLTVELQNNTDRSLDNVRCYLCNHLVGMYPGDYEVVKLDPVNLIPAGEKSTWKVQDISSSDIVSSRAILITDSNIFWADSRESKNQKSKDAASEISARQNENGEPQIDSRRDSLFKACNIRWEIAKNEKQLIKNEKLLKVYVPRSLNLVRPSFCLETENEMIYPEKAMISGNDIVIIFPYKEVVGDIYLTVYSKNKEHKIKL